MQLSCQRRDGWRCVLSEPAQRRSRGLAQVLVGFACPLPFEYRFSRLDEEDENRALDADWEEGERRAGRFDVQEGSFPGHKLFWLQSIKDPPT